MANLCNAFNRIVPRYQFAPDQSAFVIEELGKVPKKECRNCPRQFGCSSQRCPSKCYQTRCYPKFNSCNKTFCRAMEGCHSLRCKKY